MQDQDTDLGAVADIWSKLSTQLPQEIANDKYFIKQKEIGLTPVAVAAHILHPKYKGAIFISN